MMSPFCKTIYRGSVKLTDLQQLIQYGPARKHSDPALPTHWKVRAQRLSIAMEQGHHPSTPQFMTLPSTWPPKDACFLQPQTVPEDHAGTSQLVPRPAPRLPGPQGLGRPIRMLTGVARQSPSPSPSQAHTHKFLRSVAPRKAFLGMAWMAFSLRSLRGQSQRENTVRKDFSRVP